MYSIFQYSSETKESENSLYYDEQKGRWEFWGIFRNFSDVVVDADFKRVRFLLELGSVVCVVGV